MLHPTGPYLVDIVWYTQHFPHKFILSYGALRVPWFNSWFNFYASVKLAFPQDTMISHFSMNTHTKRDEANANPTSGWKGITFPKWWIRHALSFADEISVNLTSRVNEGKTTAKYVLPNIGKANAHCSRTHERRNTQKGSMNHSLGQGILCVE